MVPTKAVLPPLAEKELRILQEQREAAADTLARCERLLAAMESMELTEELLEECPELAKAKLENEKLKYRIGILKQSIAEQEKINASKGIGGSKKPAVGKPNGDAPAEKKPKKGGENTDKRLPV